MAGSRTFRPCACWGGEAGRHLAGNSRQGEALLETRVVVHTIVQDGARILLLKRSRGAEIYPGMWDVAGGLLEPGEDPEEGARRELLEEADLKVGGMTPCAVLANTDRKRSTHFITIFFRADYAGGRVGLDFDEHREFCWRSREECLGMPLVPLLRQVLLREAGRES